MRIHSILFTRGSGDLIKDGSRQPSCPVKSVVGEEWGDVTALRRAARSTSKAVTPQGDSGSSASRSKSSSNMSSKCVSCADLGGEWSRRRRRGRGFRRRRPAKAVVRSNFLTKGSRTRVIHLGTAVGPDSPFAWRFLFFGQRWAVDGREKKFVEAGFRGFRPRGV